MRWLSTVSSLCQRGRVRSAWEVILSTRVLMDPSLQQKGNRCRSKQSNRGRRKVLRNVWERDSVRVVGESGWGLILSTHYNIEENSGVNCETEITVLYRKKCVVCVAVGLGAEENVTGKYMQKNYSLYRGLLMYLSNSCTKLSLAVSYFKIKISTQYTINILFT